MRPEALLSRKWKVRWVVSSFWGCLERAQRLLVEKTGEQEHNVLRPEEEACSGWRTGNGWILTDVDSVWEKQCHPWERQEFGQKVSMTKLRRVSQTHEATGSNYDFVSRVASLAVGVWAAGRANLRTSLFRTHFSCYSYAFCSRWFVNEQVVSLHSVLWGREIQT